MNRMVPSGVEARGASTLNTGIFLLNLLKMRMTKRTMGWRRKLEDERSRWRNNKRKFNLREGDRRGERHRGLSTVEVWTRRRKREKDWRRSWRS